jgi:hypothetical protein
LRYQSAAGGLGGAPPKGPRAARAAEPAGAVEPEERGVKPRVNARNRMLILAIVLAIASLAMYVSVFLKVGGG